MIILLINYCTGYCNIEVDGYYIERFINECIKQGIFLWGLGRKKQGIITARIGREDIALAKEIARKNQCIIINKGERGIPVLWKKYKNRKVMIIMIILLVIVINSLSKFIWNIEIQGNERIATEEILRIAYSNGIKIGKLKKSIKTEEVINKIRIERTDISWVGIDIKGTNAIIKVVEANEKPEIINENDYCNIIADKEGRIEKIYAQNGTAMVQEGDFVKKGDVLISGWMEGEFTDKQYVNASGVIKATIKYTKSKKIEKSEIKRETTGKKDKKIAIKFNNFKINLYKRLSKFKKYDTIYTEKKLKIFPNLYLPVKLILYDNYEVNEVEYNNDYDKAKSYGEKSLNEEINELINGEILNQTTDIMEYDNYYLVQITYEVIEEIGTKEKLCFERMDKNEG